MCASWLRGHGRCGRALRRVGVRTTDALDDFMDDDGCRTTEDDATGSRCVRAMRVCVCVVLCCVCVRAVVVVVDDWMSSRAIG